MNCGGLTKTKADTERHRKRELMEAVNHKKLILKNITYFFFFLRRLWRLNVWVSLKMMLYSRSLLDRRCLKMTLPVSFVSLAHLPIGLADVSRPVIGSLHTMLYWCIQGPWEAAVVRAEAQMSQIRQKESLMFFFLNISFFGFKCPSTATC